MKFKFDINSDIKYAETLPANFYKSIEVFETVREKIFLNSWQWIGDKSILNKNNNLFPLTVLPGFIINANRMFFNAKEFRTNQIKQSQIKLKHIFYQFFMWQLYDKSNNF